MPCTTPDGKPTASGRKVILAINQGKEIPEDISATSGLPLFRVRSGLRELIQAGYVKLEGEKYTLTPKGLEGV